MIAADELRFRLNSITSMLTKKEQEVVRLREELENSKRLQNECRDKMRDLEAALEACRKEVGSHGVSGTPVIKPVRQVSYF